MKRALNAALWFILFESAYWTFGNRFFQVIRETLFYGNFDLLSTLGEKAYFLMSAPGLLISVYALTMFCHHVFLGIRENQRKALEEAVM